MNVTTQQDLQHARALGAKLPKDVTDAEAVLATVQERLARRPLDIGSELASAAPKDVEKLLDRVADESARREALGRSGALNAAGKRLARVWRSTKVSVIDELMAGIADKVTEANDLAARVPVHVAEDLNSTTDPALLADGARLRVVLAEISKVVRFSGTTVRGLASDTGQEYGGVEFAVIRLLDTGLDYSAVWDAQKHLKTPRAYHDVLSPVGLVKLRAAGFSLTIHSVADQASRLKAVYVSRQSYVLEDGKLLQVSESTKAYRNAVERSFAEAKSRIAAPAAKSPANGLSAGDGETVSISA